MSKLVRPTLGDCMKYGRTLPKIAGGAGPTLVGTIGALTTTGQVNNVTPPWGTGEARTAGNLLVCWVGNDTGYASPYVALGPHGSDGSDGWRVAAEVHNNYAGMSLFYKIATGGDAAPTIWAAEGIPNTAFAGQLAEFSGITAVVDQIATRIRGFGEASPAVATCPMPDAATGDLVLFGAMMRGGTVGTHAVNNGVVTHVSTNGSDASFGYGVTTGHASPDSDSFSYSGGPYGVGLVLVSFKSVGGSAGGIPVWL